MIENHIKGFSSTSGDDFQLNTITMLKHAASFFPETELTDRNLDGTLFRYTYREAYDRVKKLANALKDLGIRPGDRVGVMEWNTHCFYELYFAISGIGAVLVQINPRLSENDRTYVLNHSGTSFLFVTELMLPLIEPLVKNLPLVKGFCIITDKSVDQISTCLSPVKTYERMLDEALPDHQWEMIDETSAFSACYTSGTTGRPKGVYYSHRAIYIHTMAGVASLQVGLKDVVMQTVPMFHCHGWGIFLIATMTGTKLIFPGIYTAETTHILVDLMVSEKVTMTCGAPAIFLPMLEYIKTLPQKPDFTGLRMFSGATEPSLALMKGYWDLGHAEIIHAYGATESAPIVTVNFKKPILDELPEDQQWEYKKKQGLPLTGIDFRVVDEKGNDVPRDGTIIGEILVRGPWITSSYYNDERNQDAFTNGYWRSGDGGTLDKNGYLKISDRFKDLIKSGGEWISTIDLENQIMGHGAVLEAAVVGITHPKWEERPLALVVLRNAVQNDQLQNNRVQNNPVQTDHDAIRNGIYDLLSNNFAKWQFPDEILFVDTIPKTSVGKFSKKEIRAAYGQHYMR